MMNKRNFNVEIDGKETVLSVIKPTPAIEQKASLIYAKAFAEYLKGGAILKAKLDSVIREQKIWDDEKEAKFKEISLRLVENRSIVEGKKQGISLKKAKDAAIQMRRDRMAFQNLLSERTQLEGNTVEGLAEQAKFNYLVSQCTVYSDTGNNVFDSPENYLERADNVAMKAAAHFAMLHYEYDPESEKKLPENEFLIKYKLCKDDETLHLINEKGQLVDAEGKLVDKDGRYVGEDGTFVDYNGKSLSETDKTFPFVDDKGLPIVETSECPSNSI